MYGFLWKNVEHKVLDKGSRVRKGEFYPFQQTGLLSLNHWIIFVKIKEDNMNFEATKLELMYLLLQSKNESLLSKLKRVFDEESNEFYFSDITTLQIEQKLF